MINLGANNECLIAEVDYAIQGTAILGLKEAGKTVTGKKCAEGLLNATIPIVVFDPSGMWKYLRVRKEGKGYPVVAVGSTDCDLPLIEDTISDVLIAAREKGISLIVDLHGNRNKSVWRRVVGSIVDTLLDHNTKYGTCHLFIEEAREFAPQRVVHDLGVIYGKIESLCAIGGNASVGYTLINQRAEDVNKSVLELCERMILHNQAGKNSLKGMEEWFKRSRLDAPTYEGIMRSLPRLGKGECWVISHTAHEPIYTHIHPLETFHPDRRKPESIVSVKRGGVDVSTFVDEIKKALAEAEKTKVAVPSKRGSKTDAVAAQAIYAPALSEKLAEAEALVNKQKAHIVQLEAQEGIYKDRVRSLVSEADSAIVFREALRNFIGDMQLNIGGAPVNIDAVVAQVLSRIPTNGSSYTVAPIDGLKKKFLEESKARLLENIRGLTADQQKLMKFLESVGKAVTAGDVCKRCFGVPDSGASAMRVKDIRLSLRDLGFIRIDKNAQSYPNLREKIVQDLQFHGATDEEVDQVYVHIIAELL